MKPAEIDLQIDELVLHGFAASDRRRIGEVVERELGRLLAQAAAGGALPRGLTANRAVDHGDGGVVHLIAGAAPEVAGAQVAEAVYRALAGPAAAVGPARAISPPQHLGSAATPGGTKP
jgi:hypothetical protein